MPTYTRILRRRDTAANWTSANPVLPAGQQGFETDTGKYKLGDGVTAWNSLSYPGFSASGQGNWIAADAGAAPTVAPTAAGADAISIGDGTTAAGANGLVIGNEAVGGASAHVISFGRFSNSGVTAGAFSITIGQDDSATDNAQATGAGAIAVGSSGGSTGNAARAAGANAIAVGSATGAIDGPIASAANAVAIGSANPTTAGALASTTGAIAIGSAAEADGTSAIGIGYFANSGITAGAYSICIGADNDATDNAQASASGSIAIGSSAGSTGNGARASSTGAVAIGSANSLNDGAIASNVGAIAIGAATASVAGALSSNVGTIAIGAASTSNGIGSVAIGRYVNSGVTAGDYSVTIGADDDATDNTQATGASAIAIGSSAGSTGDGARASGANSIAIGGASGADSAPIASGTHTTAIGNLGSATRYGEFNFGVTGATASLISKFSLRGTTTNNTPTEIFIRGTASNRITIASDTGAGFIATCAARRTDADGECAFFKVEGGIDNNAGTTAGFGATPFVTTPVTTDFTTATVVASADNINDALVFTVTGETAKTINWLINVEITQITG